MVITQGFSQSLDLLCRTLAARGARTIAVETPSLAPLWDTIAVVGPAPRRRADGRRTARGWTSSTGCARTRSSSRRRTSSRRGQVMAAERRIALVAWARRRNRLLIEDDYDAENRYDRLPIGALQGLDPSHVAHAGTASKTLAPGLRLGWLSLPAELVAPLIAMKHLADSGSPTIDQVALATLIERGDYERHVARSRQEYRTRRDRLVVAVARELPGLGPCSAIAAGVHALLPLPDDVDDVAWPTPPRPRSGSTCPPLSTSYVPGAERGSTPRRAACSSATAGSRQPASTRPWRRCRGRPAGAADRRPQLTRNPAASRVESDAAPGRAYAGRS